MDDVAHDWQGRLPVVCQECYEARPNADTRNLREWKKLCKTRWAAPAMPNGMDLRRARTSGWDQARKDIDEAWCGVVWCAGVLCGLMRCVVCHVVLCGVIGCDAMLCDTV